MKDLTDIKLRLFARDNWQCQYPGCPIMGASNLQLAHKIAKTKSNRKYIKKRYNLKFGKEIDKVIHHDYNLISSCGKHNSYFNIGNNPCKRDELLNKILGDIYE